MIIDFDVKKVANLLKTIVNQQCEDGFLWYENIGELPNIFEINHAIEILEKIDTEKVTITQD